MQDTKRVEKLLKKMDLPKDSQTEEEEKIEELEMKEIEKLI
jgi:hypothetical protein